MAQDKTVILKVQGLTKDFTSGAPFLRKSIQAVVDLHFEVYRGEVFGFLGPNGAGKTTTLNMLLGITRPTAGRIIVFGRPFAWAQVWPLERIGYMPESTFLPGYMTVLELLSFFARLGGLDDEEAAGRIVRLLKSVGLSAQRLFPVAKLSMGQRRLVDLLLTLINDPDLVFLDEPTVYLDPLAIERFRQMVLDLKDRGKTVFVSSHMLPEIERLADRVAIIDQGRLLECVAKDDFLRQGGLEREFLRLIRRKDEDA